MSACLVCGADVAPALDLGRMPMSNAFRAPGDSVEEFLFDLRLGHCVDCGMVQLMHRVPADAMFHADYAYFSSTSRGMAAHFRAFGRWLVEEAAPDGAGPIVEIGSNDGILLAPLAEAGETVIGVEPSANVARAATDRGVPTEIAFFGLETARRLRARLGPARAVVGANVTCHVEAIHDYVAGVAHLLAGDGVFVFEDPWLGTIVEQTAVDQIYDEHVFYFAADPLARLAAMHGLELVDALAQPVHGGSMRWVMAPAGRRRPSDRLARVRAREAGLGLRGRQALGASLAAFAGRATAVRDELRATLERLKRKGLSLAGVGATAKSATTLNWARIGPDLLDWISDTTPAKQGRLTPGMRIPVVPQARFVDGPPDAALLLAWNHDREIRQAFAWYAERGGRWITYVPAVRVG